MIRSTDRRNSVITLICDSYANLGAATTANHPVISFFRGGIGRMAQLYRLGRIEQ
ncbi:MAG: hypothetical protein WC560_07175 [Syntrophales bacterium]